MNRPLCLAVSLGVLAAAGCQKKAEAPVVAGQPATTESAAVAQSASVAKEAPPSAPLPGEPAIIAKARAYVGPEAALNGVKSIHFVGTLTMVDSADPKPAERAAVEIYFQSPEQQRIQSTTSTNVEITAVDGYDAWQRRQDATDPKKWQMRILGADQIKRLRANTWETLGFYRGIERHGGRIEDQGPATMDGVACEKLAFIYAPNVIFYRYLDLAKGRLVATETESGTSIREQGEMMAGGIRFPKTIVTVAKVGSARTQTITLNFDKITVNETLPPQLFAVPALPAK